MHNIKHIILDNGHGIETKGICSPILSDGSQLLEYDYNRKVVSSVDKILKSKGIESTILVPELDDMSLARRCFRVNHLYWLDPNSLLISVHVNVSTSERSWAMLKGWEAHVYRKDSISDELAEVFYQEANSLGLKLRPYQFGRRPAWPSNFQILRKVKCPAILTENLYMDNMEDCKFLLSDIGFKTIVDLHVYSILRIVNS